MSAVSTAQGADQSLARQLTSTAAYHYTAETHAPVKREGAVKAGVIAWQCKAAQCTVSGPWPSPDVAACKALAQAVGEIKRYGHATKSLSAAQLAECNAQKAGMALSPAFGAMLPVKPPAATPAPAPPLSLAQPPASGESSARPLPSPTKTHGPIQPPAKLSVLPTVATAPARRVATPIVPNTPLASRYAAGGSFAPPTASSAGSQPRAANPPAPNTGVARFVPKTVTAAELTMTGLPSAGESTEPRFVPKTVTAAELTMTGLRVHADKTRPTGESTEPKTVTTAELTMTGLPSAGESTEPRFVPKTVGTAELTMTGLRSRAKPVTRPGNSR